MATFRITGPDGGSYEVTAPDDADEAQVLEYVRANAGGGEQRTASLAPETGRVSQFAPSQELRSPPPPTWGETAKDVAKSIPSGIASGVLGVGSMHGNIEWLGRRGIDWASDKMGLGDPKLSEGQFFPTYSDFKADAERRTGVKLHEPETRTGKYAKTISEFAVPMGAASRGLSTPARVSATVAPAVVSETAGQMTEGTKYEPWARMGGAVAGSMLPRTAIRTVTPNPIAPERQHQLNVLEQEGVTSLTAGQRTGHRPLQWAESVTQDTPFAGRRAAELQREAGEQFTSAALTRAGIQADRATPGVMDAAFDRLGQQFENLAQHATVPVNGQLVRDLRNIVNDYNAIVAPSMRAPIVNDIVDDVAQVLGGTINGQAYGATRSALDRQARATRFSNPQLSEALYALRNILDDAAEQSLPQNLRGQYAQARHDYRNLLVLEKAASGAGPNAVEGIISPAQLRNAAKTSDRRAYTRGTDDLSELARAGVNIMTPLPQSGTAPRAYAQGLLQILSGTGGYGVAGPVGAAGAMMAPGLMGRALMSGPVQGYLGNQALAPLYHALDRPALWNHTMLSGPMLEDMFER